MLNAAHSPSRGSAGRCAVQKQKARFLLLQRFRKGDEICFKRDETNFRDLKENPTFAERLCAGFSLFALVVARLCPSAFCLSQNARRRAAAPPLPEKSLLTQIFFGNPVKRASFLTSRANSLFPEEPKVFGKSGALCQKCDFGTRSKLLRHVAECRAFAFPRQRGALCGAKAKSAVFAFAEISEGGRNLFQKR